MTLPDIDHPLCNADLDALRFKPHGSLIVWVDGSIIHFDLTGPFNLEFASSVAMLADKLYADFTHIGSFAEIIVFRKSILMPFEAISRVGDFIRKWQGRGSAPLATAWVVDSEIDGSFIMLPLFEKTFAESGRPFRHFGNVDEAEIWIKELLDEAFRVSKGCI